MKKITLFFLVLVLVAMPLNLDAKKKSKKEKETAVFDGKADFRGAWIQTAWQDRYQRMTPEQCKAYLTSLVDMLHQTGFNAVIFQVRPEGDAFSQSHYEPWSRFLTGKQGKAPVPQWDPMDYMIKLCHDRQMEFHAWINPYRVSTSKSLTMDRQHIYHQHPEWFVEYDNKLYFNPGLPESRAFIRSVVKDIVSRYDVDAIHMDDYFYPYPVAGKVFDDKWAFETYAPELGIDTTLPEALSNFRRRNVDILIKTVNEDIKFLKPWVRFGISPFGVWRNITSDPRGSQTNALQCYDALYADVLKWTELGWVDYMVPQLYWELDHKRAPGRVLNPWWNDNANGRHMYIGQSVETTMKTADPDSNNPTELDHKIRLTRQLPNIQGNCWWPGYSITRNSRGVCDSLATRQQSTIALVPAYTWLDNIAPDEVTNLKLKSKRGTKTLTWRAPETTDPMQVAKAFVIYRFAQGEEVDLENAAAIQAVTPNTEYTVPASTPKGSYRFVVTVLDRVNNESPEGKAVTVKL